MMEVEDRYHRVMTGYKRGEVQGEVDKSVEGFKGEDEKLMQDSEVDRKPLIGVMWLEP